MKAWGGVRALKAAAFVAGSVFVLLIAGPPGGAASQSVTLTLPTQTLVHGGLYDSFVDTAGPVGGLPAEDIFLIQDKTPFKLGMVIQVDNELMFITALGDGGVGNPDTVKVLRGHAGTAVVSHLSGRSVFRRLNVLDVSISNVAAESAGNLETAMNSSEFEASGAVLTSAVNSSATQIPVSEISPFYVDRTALIDSEKMLISGLTPGWLTNSGATIVMPTGGTTLAAAVDDTVGELPIADRTRLQVGWTVRIDGEYMNVTGLIEGSPDIMEVTRAVGGSSAQSHLNGASVVTSTTLSAGVDSSVTSIPVGDRSLLLTGWTVRIDSEYMTIVGLTEGSPDSMQVTRGALGSTASSHSGGAAVQPPLDDGNSTVPVSDQSLLQVGWTIRVDGEFMKINGLNDGSPDTMEVDRGVLNTAGAEHVTGAQIFGSPHRLTVVRGHAGTSPASHSQGAPVAQNVRTVDLTGTPTVGAGSHLQIDSEKMLTLTAPDVAGNVKVIRGILGSVPAAHSAGVAVSDIDGFGAAGVHLDYGAPYAVFFAIEPGFLLASTGRVTDCSAPVNQPGSLSVMCTTQGELPLGALGAGSALRVGLVTQAPTGLTSQTMTLSMPVATDTSGDGYSASVSAPVTVNVAPCADFNSDFAVSVIDIAQIKARSGQTSASPGWNPIFDLRPDGAINVADIGLAKQQFGIRCYRP